jgi:uncharacterized membrane protein YphA (DoxX/SURF4 family)
VKDVNDMDISTKLDQVHSLARQNKWLRYFAVFNRVALAVGFLPAGFVKIMGERFTSLSVNHPMGNYLEALHKTGYYYTFIGVLQVIASILLLIPRATTLGAVLYFPIIFNICILSYAVRFDGSLLTSPLMVLACLYLLCWDYHKLKFILPFNHSKSLIEIPNAKTIHKFPMRFFAGVFAAVLIVVLINAMAFNAKPRNTFRDCNEQFKGTYRTNAGCDFCTCIHRQGKSLDNCLDAFDHAPDDRH